MKKALIVTTQYVNNYGAVLQAYGMHKMLEAQGWEHEFLNQYATDSRIYEKVFPINKKAPYRLLQNFRRFRLARKWKHRLQRFAEFRKAHLPQTAMYTTQEEVQKADLAYDLYITGGDQMFNRSCLNRPANLLEFGNKSAPRISYSTSIGSAVFSATEKEQLISRLQAYTELSLREASGAAFLTEGGVSCPVHTNIDGVFLISKEEWSSVAAFDSATYPESFILVYELMPHPDLGRAIELARKQYNLPVIVIATGEKTACRADYIVRDAGPAEFLGFFSKAAMVITTSFHGTCFSVINEKPFLSLIRNNEQRINGLLDMFGLSACYATACKALPPVPDYTQAKETIEKERRRTIDYLGRFFE